MAAGSRAVIQDSVASGRVAHGERRSFMEMDSRTEVFLCGKPAFVNRILIAPASRNPRETALI
jgi:urease accessory protein UreH